MFSFLSKTKNRETAFKLLNSTYLSLKDILPDLYENSTYWKNQHVKIEAGQISYGAISHNNDYVEKNKKRHNKHYTLGNVFVASKRANTGIPIIVNVRFDLITSIKLDTKDLYKSVDPANIDISKIAIEKVVLENPDKKSLLKIIGHLDADKQTLIEIDDTFEIELGNKKFYTIADMEDGNYLAVNNKGEVFRLHHDSDEQIKKINPSIGSFLDSYNGNKEDLQTLFD